LEESVRNLSERLLKVQDEERSRLGRELHDSTAQTLSALSINLALLKEHLRCSTSPEVSQALTELTELAQQASREIRNTAYLLHPPMLEEADLRSALGRFVQGFVERTRIQVSLEIEPGLNRISKDIEMALFRVVQESLSNVYRHSGSPTARVRLALESSRILLEVSDEGYGLPANPGDQHLSALSAPGMGISGMRQRIQQLGGSFEASSTKPGFTVKAVVPLGPVGADSEARFTSKASDLVSLTSELVESA
jgi:signal transduction histidine kinase